MIPIQGLWETHLTVRDLDRSITFYRDVVGLTLAHRVPERHAAFFWIGPPRHAMLGLWSIHTSPIAMRLHYAFQVSLDDVVASVAALRLAGLQPLSGDGVPIEEPVVGPEDVLVEVAATALNRADLLQRRGLYPEPGPKRAHEVPGMELSGRVVAVGDRVSRWSRGDEVMAIVSGAP